MGDPDLSKSSCSGAPASDLAGSLNCRDRDSCVPYASRKRRAMINLINIELKPIIDQVAFPRDL